MSAAAANVVPLDRGVTCLALRRIEKGSILGFCVLKINAWNLIVRDCKWMSGERGDWVALPSSSYTDKDGKKRYTPIVEFSDKEAARRFQDAAIAAVRAFRS